MVRVISKAKREVRKLRRGEEDKHLEMLNLCFNPWGDKEKWRKKYVQPNFDVAKNVIVVEENGKWAGGGTAWFRDVFLKNNNEVEVYTAGDLYVHPNFRGKGLYSTAMRNLNEIAQKRGAVLGFAFPSIYTMPSLALAKYGFVKIFYPATRILLLNPEKFVEYIISDVQEVYLPKKFDGIKLKLVVAFNSHQGRETISKTFYMKKGKLFELTNTAKDTKNIDLIIHTNIDVLLKVSSYFYRKKKTLFLAILLALLQRRLKFRFSLKFLRMLLGL